MLLMACRLPAALPSSVISIMANTTTKRVNKFLYGWKLYVNYGQGWEYEIFEETRAGYLENRKAYRENSTYPQRWSRGRETNPAYVPPVTAAVAA